MIGEARNMTSDEAIVCSHCKVVIGPLNRFHLVAGEPRCDSCLPPDREELVRQMELANAARLEAKHWQDQSREADKTIIRLRELLAPFAEIGQGVTKDEDGIWRRRWHGQTTTYGAVPEITFTDFAPFLSAATEKFIEPSIHSAEHRVAREEWAVRMRHQLTVHEREAKAFVEFVHRHTLPARAKERTHEETHSILINHPFAKDFL